MKALYRYNVISHLQTVSMYKSLSHSFTPDVDVLDLLRGNVLSLCQLKDVLLTVHNFQCAILSDHNVRHAKDTLKITASRAFKGEKYILAGDLVDLQKQYSSSRVV